MIGQRDTCCLTAVSIREYFQFVGAEIIAYAKSFVFRIVASGVKYASPLTFSTEHLTRKS
jgi:hypothetical protein